MSSEPPCPCRIVRSPLADHGLGLEEAPELIPFLECLPDESDTQVTYYRCRACGARWQVQNEPFMHADVRVLIRSVLDEDGQPLPLIFHLPQTGLAFQVGTRRR